MSGSRRALIVAGAAAALVAGLFALRAAIAVDPLAQLRRDETGRTGSWHLPRGGPYILGFSSPGPAELVIGDQQVVGQGIMTKRLVFAAGVQPVTFRAPPGARLLWHPPGRRGALEYVPASSLSPEPPATARFSAPGTSRGDAAIALLLVLVVVGALIAYRPRRFDRATAVVVGGVFVLALVVRLATLGDAGQTWDEDEYWSSGRNYVSNVLALDFRDTAWRWNFEHPPVTKYVAGVGALAADGYGAARALFALLGAGACALAAAIGWRLFGRHAGLAAGVVAALTPHLVGHAQIVGHETTSTFFWALAVWLALRVGDEPEARATVIRRMVWVGVALGLAVGTRFANLLAAPVVAVVLLSAADSWPRALRTAAWGLAVIPATAVATFVAIWPRMWSSPMRHLDQAWDKLKQPHTPEPYLGVFTTDPAWHYFPVYLLAVTPVVVLAFAVGGGAWRGAMRREWRSWLVVAAFLLLPFGVAWSPVRQDGVRYVLAALEPLAVAAGAGIDQLGAALRARVAWTPSALVAAVGVYLVLALASVRPYYIDYYAETVGGARAAQARRVFEVGWWGEGIGAAVAHVNAHAAPGERLYKLVQPTHVNWFRADLFQREAATPETADWIVVNDVGVDMNDRVLRRPPFRVPPGFTLVHDVRAGGASLVRVYHRDGAGAGAAPSPR